MQKTATVSILANDLPLDPTSAVAGADWGPYLVSDARVARWSEFTRSEFTRLSEKGPVTGVRLVFGVEASIKPTEPPPWAFDLPDFRRCEPDELSDGLDGFMAGWRYTVPLIDMRTYLPYLETVLKDAGISIQVDTVDSLDAIPDSPPYIINCTGMRAEHLASDKSMRRLWGQLVLVENPGIDTFFQDNCEGGELTYILPHGDIVALGGTAVDQKPDALEQDRNRTAIIERCAAIEPSSAAPRSSTAPSPRGRCGRPSGWRRNGSATKSSFTTTDTAAPA